MADVPTIKIEWPYDIFDVITVDSPCPAGAGCVTFKPFDSDKKLQEVMTECFEKGAHIGELENAVANAAVAVHNMQEDPVLPEVKAQRTRLEAALVTATTELIKARSNLHTKDNADG